MAERKQGSGKREMIAPKGDKRLARRDQQGRFTEQDDLGRSLPKDVKRQAKTATSPGSGDRGDQKGRSRSTRSSNR